MGLSPSLKDLANLEKQSEPQMIHGQASVKDLLIIEGDLGVDTPQEFTKLVTQLYQKNAAEGFNNPHTDSYLERVD